MESLGTFGTVYVVSAVLGFGYMIFSMVSGQIGHDAGGEGGDHGALGGHDTGSHPLLGHGHAGHETGAHAQLGGHGHAGPRTRWTWAWRARSKRRRSGNSTERNFQSHQYVRAQPPPNACVAASNVLDKPRFDGDIPGVFRLNRNGNFQVRHYQFSACGHCRFDHAQHDDVSSADGLSANHTCPLTSRVEEAIGHEAEVCVSIQPGRTGEVTYVLGSKRYNMPAKSNVAESVYKRGAKVMIADVREGVVFVDEWQGLTI